MAEAAGTFEPENVRVAQTGAIYVAAAGATVPALAWNATDLTDWGASWKSLGVFDTDGVEHEFSEDIEEVVSWQKNLVRIIVKGRELMIKLNSLETRKETVEEFYGASFSTSGSAGQELARINIENQAVRIPKSYGFEWVDKESAAVWRLIIPRGQASDPESPKFTNEEALKWGMSLRALGGSTSYLGYWETNDPDLRASLTA